MNILFLGLGTMGMPMASHIYRAGYNITVANRSSDKISIFTKKNPSYSKPQTSSLKTLAEKTEVFITCIGGDNDLTKVAGLNTDEEGVLNWLPKGSLWIDHSTVSANVTLLLGEKAKDKGIEVLDAPISGGQAGAENATLSIMVGGEIPAFSKIEPLLKVYGKNVIHMGKLGSGQKTKMVNQLCIAGVLAGLADGLAFAKKSGLDDEKLLAAISKGAAASWQMENRGMTMLQDQFDFGFAVDWMAKDLAIVLEAASELGTPTKLLRNVLQQYRLLQEKGFGKLDSSALIKLAIQDTKK